MSEKLKIVAISDLHNQKPDIPPADILICAGDLTAKGRLYEVQSMLRWLAATPCRYKVFVGGNHDLSFDEHYDPDDWQGARRHLHEFLTENPSCIYLKDSEVVLEGIRIYGSPYTPTFYSWAFMKPRGSSLAELWDKIPEKTDILITHGPPVSILDRTDYGDDVGCADLYNEVRRKKPRYHIFGHIHEAYGVLEQDGTVFMNASVLDSAYRLCNPPHVFEISV